MNKAHGRCGVVFLMLLFFLGSSLSAFSQGKGLQAGEILEYQVFGKGLPMGEQTLRIMGEKIYQDQPILEVRMSMKSYAAFAFLFSYEEKALLYLNASDLTPVYLKKSIKENDQSWEEEYHFRPETVEKQVTTTGKEPRVSAYEAKHPLLEGLSLVYYLRQRSWRQGKNDFYYLTAKGPQAVTCKYRGEERIRVLSGYQQADVVYDPVSAITVWFSQDEHVYPLRIKVHTNMGVLTARLVKIVHGSEE